MTALRIIYVGTAIAYGGQGTSMQRMRALQELGHDVKLVGSDRTTATSVFRRGMESAQRRLFRHVSDPDLDRKILETAASWPSDLIWLDKATSVSPSTFRHLRESHAGTSIVGYSPDDMMNPANQSRYFVQSLPLYLVFFTTKSYNVRELQDLGCRRAVFVPNAYDPLLHRPVSVTEEERRLLGGEVGFIGTGEGDRERSVRHLAANGIPVKVWGDKWGTGNGPALPLLTVSGRSQYGERYPKIICSFDINLCFLRKCNRDLQTQRSVEIPACGAFMLAERTDEHRELFEEGKEAEFFSSDDELLDKVRYYLAHPDERRRIAAAGLHRCQEGGYSNHGRLRKMLEVVGEMRSDARAE